MDLWTVNPPWQNFSSMYRESVSASEAKSEVERRHHLTAALYFGVAALEAFLNQQMRLFLAQSLSEAELIKKLKYTYLLDKVDKWPKKITGKPLPLNHTTFTRITVFNNIRSDLTHAKTRGLDEYAKLESINPMDVVDTIAEYFVRFHQAQGNRFPYWIFGWNYLNPGNAAHEIIVLGEQQFCFSLRTVGVPIPGSSGWEEKWKDQNLSTYDGYISIRNLLRSRSDCEPKFAQFPFQPKLCRRWWTPEHHASCGAIAAPPGN